MVVLQTIESVVPATTLVLVAGFEKTITGNTGTIVTLGVSEVCPDIGVNMVEEIAASGCR